MTIMHQILALRNDEELEASKAVIMKQVRALDTALHGSVDPVVDAALFAAISELMLAVEAIEAQRAETVG